MKNNGALKALKDEALQSIIKLLQDQEGVGIPQQYIRQTYQGYLLNDLMECYKVVSLEKATKALEGVSRLEALEYIDSIHEAYYSELLDRDDIMECLRNDGRLYIELMECICTDLYFEKVQHREDYTIRDLITLLKEEE